MIKIATWNVNSLKVRLEQVVSWLQSSQTDILALQETKLEDLAFPKAVFEDLGYEVVCRGQKTYNGVACLSRYPVTEVSDVLPNFDDNQKRVLAMTVQDIRVLNFYVPNGQSLASSKYEYKLSWLQAMTEFVRTELQKHPKLVVLGDFNIAPEDIDVYDPKQWEDQVLVSLAERAYFQKLLHYGMVDVVRQYHPELDNLYSWWDYRAAAFRRGMGLRIDHILLSSTLAQETMAAGIDVQARRHERPSDHAPVWLTLQLNVEK